MRAFRTGHGAMRQHPFIQAAPTSIFARRHMDDARDSDQTEARKFANQLAYGNPNYSYDGKPAPSFYGYSGIGYGGVNYGYSTTSNINNYTPSVYIVPRYQPTEEWVYVTGAGEPQPPGWGNNIQSHFLNVPTPKLSELPAAKEGGLVATGTDREICIYRPSTDEWWEVFAFDNVGHEEGGLHTFQNAGYVSEFSKWSGAFPTEGDGSVKGARATGVMCSGGTIMWQDLVEVLRGGKIKHALTVGILVAKAPNNGAFRLPAKRNDNRENTAVYGENGSTLNPAKGTIDAVKEGGWYVFPKESRAKDYGISGPLEVAVYEAIREYGLGIVDASGATTFSFELPTSLGSPFCSTKGVNPLAGDAAFAGINEKVPGSWTDPTLPILEETTSGLGSIYQKQPWQTLELLAPFAS